jgi:hypothetical protein
MPRQLAFSSIIGVVLFQGVSAAPVPLVPHIDPRTYYAFNEPHFNGTWGWTFFVNSPITVTHVAWFDQNSDGLSHSHRIGLWKDLSGRTAWPFVKTEPFGQNLVDVVQLLGSFPPIVTEGIEIPAGTSAELDGAWRKVPLPRGPLVLERGGYALGGLDNINSQDAIRYVGPFSPAPGRVPIEVGAPGFSELSDFSAPSNFFLVQGMELGPMLFIAEVPEPNGCILAAGAIVINALHMRGKRPRGSG